MASIQVNSDLEIVHLICVCIETAQVAHLNSISDELLSDPLAIEDQAKVKKVLMDHLAT